MIALLATALADPPTVLDDPAFRFCHDSLADDWNREFCPLLDGLPPERCAGLRAWCADPATGRSPGCDGGRASGAPPPGAAPAAGPDAPPRSLFAPASCASPGLGTVLGWVVAMAVALGIAAIAAMILRALGLRSPAPPPAVARPIAEDEAQSFAEAVDDVPDLPSSDLLASARAALAEGRAGEAAWLARGAVLRELGERRALRLHRARTDREYLASAEPALKPDLGEVFAAAERHRWGRFPLEPAAAEGALRAAARLLGLLALLALAPAAWGADRYGPAGDAGIARVLERHGHRVSWRADGLEGLAPGDPVDALVLDLAGVAPDDAGWAAIRSWVEAGGILVVGGDPTATFPELGERVPSTGDAAPVEALAEEGLPAPRWPDGPSHRFTAGEPWTEPAAVAGAPVGLGYVVALADPVVLWNGALVDPGNEAFLGELPYRVQARGHGGTGALRIQLATRAAGEDPDPLASVANLRLLPLVVQVLALWLTLVAWRGLPFAPLVDPPGRGRRRFAEHIDAVARHWKARRASRYALAAYAAYVLERHRATGLRLAALRAGLPAARADELVARTEAVAADPLGGPNEPARDLAHLEELWKLTRPS